jgi:KUP system potassium uptake protein
MELLNVPRTLRDAASHGLPFAVEDATYFLARLRIVASHRRGRGMARWRRRLFAVLANNARPATAHYRIPSERVFEVGIQIEL